ncbi:2-phospho-L-lactate guanylyltransferase [Mesorhizobium sp. WSM3879]|uniref:2-phospho-L-lactate guanylyltransferase n=1 Tax=Mesorhizobium sp. WSM3879 TaxID=2029406 RepID=UPI0015CB0CD2|nr:2-phospho-L-lactate guanylyltransferase [Mesorhizobium sp. WSM3879]
MNRLRGGKAKPYASCAIVPVKTLADAKSRLSSALSPTQRRCLVFAMFKDMLDALAVTPAIDAVLVVTAEPEVAELASRRGATVLHEERRLGLNAALALGAAYAKQRGAGQVLFIPADLPFVTPAELAEIMATAHPAEPSYMTIVPSRDGNGTNALLLSPPDALPPNFGPGSFERHCAQARARGLSPRAIRLKGVATDIDEPNDLAILMERSREGARYGFLHETGRARNGHGREAGVTEP